MAQVTKQPIRIYVLAKQLDLPTERLVAIGDRLGFELHGLSMLDPSQHAAIEKAAFDSPPQEPPRQPA